MLAAADELTLKKRAPDGLAKRRSGLAAQGVRCLQPERNEMSRQPQASSEKPAGPLASPGPWNLVAEGYEEVTRKFLEAFSRSGLAMLRYGGQTRVIDVACGPGTTALLMRTGGPARHLRRFLGGHARSASPQRRCRQARPMSRSSRPTARRCLSRRQLRPRHLDVRPDVLPRSRQGICRALPRSRARRAGAGVELGAGRAFAVDARRVLRRFSPTDAAAPDAGRLSGLEDRAVFEAEMREAGFTDIRVEAVTHGLCGRERRPVLARHG